MEFLSRYPWFLRNFKSNFLLYSLYCAEACIEFAWPISASLHERQYSFFRRNVAAVASVGNTASDLTSPGFEPQFFRSRDESVTVQPTIKLILLYIRSFSNSIYFYAWWSHCSDSVLVIVVTSCYLTVGAILTKKEFQLSAIGVAWY